MFQYYRIDGFTNYISAHHNFIAIFTNHLYIVIASGM